MHAATGFVHGVASIAPWKASQMLTLEGEKDVLASGFTHRGYRIDFTIPIVKLETGTQVPANDGSQRRALRSRGEGPGEIRIARSSLRLADGPGSQGRRRSREAEERRRKPRATS